jgi:hypothetical protein
MKAILDWRFVMCFLDPMYGKSDQIGIGNAVPFIAV